MSRKASISVGAAATALCMFLSACGGLVEQPLTDAQPANAPVSVEGATVRVDSPCQARVLELSLRAAEPVSDHPVDLNVWKDGEPSPFAAVTIPAVAGTIRYDVPLPSPQVRILAFSARNPSERELTRRVELLTAAITCNG